MTTWDDIALYLAGITTAMQRITKACKNISKSYQELIDYTKSMNKPTKYSTENIGKK